tara:strand:- start:482 stop:817 length:336 start_codon:yes stop_codon:yes gene_type:complete
MNDLISITANAEDQIKKILLSAPTGIDSVVVGINKTGCNGYSYKIDYGKSSDLKNYEIIKLNGAKVLVDPKAIIFLLGSIMDYQIDNISSRFVFKNPNEKSTCGCGESFNV